MKKKTIVRITAIVLAVTAFSVFGLSASVESPQEAEAASSANTGAKTAEKQETDRSEEDTAEQAKAEEKQKQRAEETISGNRQAETEAKKQESAAAAGQSTASGTSAKADTSSQSSESGTKPESGPAHTHDWKDVYETVSREIYGDKCKGCTFGTNEAGAMYEHIDKDPFDNCGSYATGVVIRIEQVREPAGKKCSCGATK